MTTRYAETWAIRDTLREALSRHTPQTGPQLFERVTAELGYVNERRLWRQLGWLRTRGFAVHAGRIHATNADPEDCGYVLGVGAETEFDRIERRACELVSAGRCTCCHGHLEPHRPRWMHGRCVRCHWILHGEMAKARREARIAMHECARCGDPDVPDGLRECDRCAGREQQYRRAV